MIALLAAAILASAPNPVVDEADVLEIMDETSLASRLASFESSGGTEIAVATFASIPRGQTAYSHSMRIAKTWDVGSRAGGRGVLIAFYRDDREAHIQVTNEVPHLTNGQAKSIIDGHMVPKFKNGDVSGGLSAGAAEVMATVRGQRVGAGVTTRPTRRLKLDDGEMMMVVIGGLILLAVISQVAKGSTGIGSRGYRRNTFWGSPSRRSSWSGSSFGGGSRSSGGGFRGRGAGGKW